MRFRRFDNPTKRTAIFVEQSTTADQTASITADLLAKTKWQNAGAMGLKWKYS